ncbi:MarR family transcriptional regulator [Cohnella lubricantis]|uniref:MarR family transcriptional regulator n=1 Tax=Cohnella lubricantis TaxID=2163172 RepID=A0A841TC69_9BACL|nr:MarR family transcriptional regulator [Cohnella lubricantis]MBB6676968.1 MarR family transcriptional regulator [Cohnella lubricantis]MBP2118373.1 DNA-binding MarR family transcriptional regulator [Cohnella lubricantis]
MKLDDSIGFLINQTGRKLSQVVNHYFAAHEMTSEQWSVLARLCEEDGISQKELAARVSKDQTNVTRILDQLQRKGLIVRMTNPEDRRSFLPSVTPEGRQMYERMAPLEEQVIALAIQGLDEKEVAKLKELLQRIANNAARQL